MKTTLLTLTQGFFALFLFSIPLQVRILIHDTAAYENGLFSEYLAGFVYISDIFLVLSGIFFGIYLLLTHHFHDVSFGNKNILKILGLIILASLIPLIWAQFPGLILKDIFHLFEFGLIYILILNIPVDIKVWLRIIIFSGLFQAIIAAFQFLFQRDLGLQFLGEKVLEKGQTGIDLFAWQGSEILRSFGTLSHPNVLAGLLIITLFLGAIYLHEKHEISSFENSKKHSSRFVQFVKFAFLSPENSKTYLSFFLFLGLLVTFSRGAWIALIIGIIILFKSFKPKWFNIKHIYLIGIIFLAVSTVFLTSVFNKDVYRVRLELMDIGSKTLIENPLGVGSSHFTLDMQDTAGKVLKPYEHQPVHNIFMMGAVENGFLGLILFIALWYFIYQEIHKHKNEPEGKIFFSLFLILFLLWNIDHYFYDTYAGQMIFWVTVALMSATFQRHKKPA